MMRFVRKRARSGGVAAILLFGAIQGCDSPSEAEQLAGQYTLTRYAGSAVPLDRGPLPDRFGRVTECRLVLTEGRLQLSGRTGGFTLEYLHRESCENRLMSRSELSGRYAADGRTLRFLVPAADGQDLHFTGRVHPDRILVVIGSPDGPGSETLEFAR